MVVAEVWLVADAARCLAAMDWTSWGLWAGASMLAASLLGVAINRRRQALTQTLREHVTSTIGPPAEENREENEEIEQE